MVKRARHAQEIASVRVHLVHIPARTVHSHGSGDVAGIGSVIFELTTDAIRTLRDLQAFGLTFNEQPVERYERAGQAARTFAVRPTKSRIRRSSS